MCQAPRGANVEKLMRFPSMRLIFLVAGISLMPLPALAAGPFVVHAAAIPDQKAIIGTVEPVHELAGRARIGGTVTTL